MTNATQTRRRLKPSNRNQKAFEAAQTAEIEVTKPSSRNSLVLALDSYWQPHKWVTVEDAIVYESKELVQQHVGQSIFVLHGGTNAKTGTRTTVETSTIIAIKGASKQQTRRTPLLSNRVLFRRDRHMCAYCGDVHAESALTRDHIIPVSKNGKDSWQNCVTACYNCNNRKGDKTLQETGQQLLYVPYVPCNYESMLLQNRRVLVDQMEFLMNGIKNKDSRALILNS